MNENRNHTTIGLKKITKNKLDKHRAPGQSYDGFLSELIGLWEKVKSENQRKVASS